MKILVVEDNEDSRILLMKQLRAHGHEIAAAADGAEALQQALIQPPDIIISDIMMPNMDGYQLCRECKQNEQLKDIPFVFYTATYTLDEDKKFALSLGAATFLVKPAEPDVFVQKLSEIVEKVQSGALAPAKIAPLEPSLFLTEYNKRVVAKLEDKVAQLEAEIAQRKRTEHTLNERVKELQCLYGIANITEKPEITLDELYQEIANLLPVGWQYPEITCAKITINGKEFKAENCTDRGPKWKQSVDIKVHGAKAGVVEVGYLEKRPELDEGPFLKEERLLIDAVGEQLGRIIERKQAKEALQAEEQNFRNSLDSSPLGIRIVTAEGETIYANQAILDIYGYSSVEELKATPVKKRYTPESYAEQQEREEKRKLGKPAPPNYEISIVRKDGEIRHLVVSRKEVVWNGETQFQRLYQDFTQRKQAEEELKRSEEFLKTIFNSPNDAISIIDVHDFTIVGANDAFLQQHGLKEEQVIGKICYQITHHRSDPCAPPDDICPLRDTVTTGEHSIAEHVHYTKDSEKMYVEVSTSPVKDENGKVIQVVHVTRDITERKKMEEQLIVTDRLASIGELASGIAHELNNPLTGVIGFSELLLSRDVPDDVKEDLKVINKEAQRTAGVVRNLLTFARKHETEKKPVDIHSIIQKVLELRAYEQKVSNIEVNTQFASDLPEITADSFRLQQVFLNIIINAEHFMTEAHGRGNLTITTERVGDIIRASFADDGPGVAKENLGHLFDPFFTTKEVGKGTGLGLSICHGIITEHGGRIYAESKLGKGATFIVELPISK